MVSEFTVNIMFERAHFDLIDNERMVMQSTKVQQLSSILNS